MPYFESGFSFTYMEKCVKIGKGFMEERKMDSGGKNRYLFQNKKEMLRKGIRDGLPVALGYFAVSFSLGISARNKGVTPLKAIVIRHLCNTTYGEYAGFTLM